MNPLSYFKNNKSEFIGLIITSGSLHAKHCEENNINRKADAVEIFYLRRRDDIFSGKR